jgi:hypothetical protein
MAMKITVGIHNGATRSNYVPLVFSVQIVKTGDVHTFSEKMTQVADITSGRIVCRHTFSFTDALCYSRLKLMEENKYFLVHI